MLKPLIETSLEKQGDKKSMKTLKKVGGTGLPVRFLQLRFLRLRVLPLSFLALTHCGTQNPYKKQTARCKINCTAADSVADAPRQTPAVNTSPQSWLRQTMLTEVSTTSENPNTQLGNLLQINPMVMLSERLALYGKLATAIANAKAKSPTPKNAFDACYINTFSAPTSSKTETRLVDNAEGTGKDSVAMKTLAVFTDFGKCASLGAPKAANGYTVSSTEHELAMRLQMSAREDTLDVTAGLFAATDTIALRNQFPIEPFPMDALKGRSEPLAFDFLFSTAGSEGRQYSRDGRMEFAIRSWEAFSVGLSAEKPLVVTILPQGKGIRLNGTMLLVRGQIQNPETENPFKGSPLSGVAVAYEFHDFTFSGAGVTLDRALGFSRQAFLEGWINVQVNDKRFRYVADGRRCEVGVFKQQESRGGTEILEQFDHMLNLCKGLKDAAE